MVDGREVVGAADDGAHAQLARPHLKYHAPRSRRATRAGADRGKGQQQRSRPMEK